MITERILLSGSRFKNEIRGFRSIADSDDKKESENLMEEAVKF